MTKKNRRRYVMLKDGKTVRLIHEKKMRGYLGQYDAQDRTIRILTPQVMYKAVLIHEMSHAESGLMRFYSKLWNWKTMSFLEVGMGMTLLLAIALMPTASVSAPIAFFASGFSLFWGLQLMIGGLEELKNRRALKELPNSL